LDIIIFFRRHFFLGLAPFQAYFSDFNFQEFDFQDIRLFPILVFNFQFLIFKILIFSAFAIHNFNITPEFQGVRGLFFFSQLRILQKYLKLTDPTRARSLPVHLLVFGQL
jgi:hypothetical protein